MPSLESGSYLECMTMIGHTAGDVLLTLFRPRGDEDWQVEVRFRYQVDDKVFGSEDRKAFQNYRLPQGASHEDVRASFDHVVRKFTEEAIRRYGVKTTVETLEIQGGIEALVKASESVSWMHIKMVPAHLGPAGEA